MISLTAYTVCSIPIGAPLTAIFSLHYIPNIEQHIARIGYGYVMTLQKFEQLLKQEVANGNVCITESTIETDNIFEI